MHQYVFQSENATDTTFVCSVCGNVIGFNKPTVGEPCAIPDATSTWLPPLNPDQWADKPCTQ